MKYKVVTPCQLAARELPRTRALLKDFLRRNRSREELKNKRRRIPFHVESSLVPLRFWSFSWSLRCDYRQKSQGASKLSVNSRRGRTEKRGFDWQLVIKMLPSSPIRFSVYPVYGFVKRTMTAPGVFFPLLPFLYFRPVVLSLGLQSFLAWVDPLSISSSKMATEQHRDTMYVCSPGYSFARLVIYTHLRETGSRIADTITWEGQVILFFQ